MIFANSLGEGYDWNARPTAEDVTVAASTLEGVGKEKQERGGADLLHSQKLWQWRMAQFAGVGLEMDIRPFPPQVRHAFCLQIIDTPCQKNTQIESRALLNIRYLRQ